MTQDAPSSYATLLAEGNALVAQAQRAATQDFAQARALWIAFYNAIEAEQADGKELADARPFASKAAEQAARIAGVITLFNDPEALEVGAQAMDGAIQIVGFYLNEHLRLMGTGKQQQADKRLRTLLEWLQAHSSGQQVKPPPMGAGGYLPQGDAPGTYVFQK